MDSVTSYDRINAALEDAGRFGKRYGAWTLYNCPAHEDSDPSLGLVYNPAKQRSVVRCFTGCDDRDVLAAIGLGVVDLYDDARRRPSDRAVTYKPRVSPSPRPVLPARHDDPLGAQTGPARIAVRYYYRLPDGTAAGRVTRAYIPHEKGTKRVFWQHRWDGNTWARGGFPALLYNLRGVIAAVHEGSTIYLVEGEKDADNASRAGLAATCNAMGAGKFRAAHAEQLAGARRVVIVADRDEAGRRHSAASAVLLRGRVGSVEVVEAAVGKDISDHLAAGLGPDDLMPIDRNLAAATQTSPPITKEQAMISPDTDNPVTVYTKPDCPQCAATKRTLDRLGVGYTEVDVSTDADARRWLLGIGYTAAPVVVAGENHFAGYRPDRLAALGQARADRGPGSAHEQRGAGWHMENGVVTSAALEQPAEGWRMENGVIVADDPAHRQPATSARPPAWATRPGSPATRPTQARGR